jgi:SAM-dependent methyltransferase
MDPYLTYLIERNLKPSDIILDAGSGRGYFLNYLNSRGYVTLGVDLSKQDVKREKQIIGSVEYLPFKDETFDACLSIHVIGYLKKPSLFVSEAFRILKRKGLLIIVTPNMISLMRMLKREKWSIWTLYKDSPHYKYNRRPHEMPIRNLTPHTLRMMLVNAGFRKIKFTHNIFPLLTCKLQSGFILKSQYHLINKFLKNRLLLDLFMFVFTVTPLTYLRDCITVSAVKLVN